MDIMIKQAMGAQWPEGWRNLVYVREVKADELPRELAEKLDGAQHETFYAIHNSQGAALAISDSREAAIYGAKQHHLLPQSVH